MGSEEKMYDRKKKKLIKRWSRKARREYRFRAEVDNLEPREALFGSILINQIEFFIIENDLRCNKVYEIFAI